MTKREVIDLLSPSIWFILIGVSALLFSEQARRCWDPAAERTSQLAYESFEHKVQSGERQLTSDQWLQALRWSRAGEQRQRRLIAGVGDEVRLLFWFALGGVGWQLISVLMVRQRMKSRDAGPTKPDAANQAGRRAVLSL